LDKTSGSCQKGSAVENAVKAIRNGDVIAYPTEGVWGLGCDPSNAQAVNKILELKGRPQEKGLILIASSAEQLAEYVEDAPEFPDMETPTTWLVRHAGKTPGWISGGRKKVAAKVSSHPMVKNICDELGKPVVSTSANPAGLKPAMTDQEVTNYFGDLIDIIVPGELGGQTGASQIIDWETKQVIRKAGQ